MFVITLEDTLANKYENLLICRYENAARKALKERVTQKLTTFPQHHADILSYNYDLNEFKQAQTVGDFFVAR
jgi:hypothetical protein